jgi:hypothetical protein
MSGKFNKEVWKYLLENIREALLYDEAWAMEKISMHEYDNYIN